MTVTNRQSFWKDSKLFEIYLRNCTAKISKNNVNLVRKILQERELEWRGRGRNKKTSGVGVEEGSLDAVANRQIGFPTRFTGMQK